MASASALRWLSRLMSAQRRHDGHEDARRLESDPVRQAVERGEDIPPHVGWQRYQSPKQRAGELSVADRTGEPVVPASSGEDLSAVGLAEKVGVRTPGRDGEQRMVVDDDHVGRVRLLVGEFRILGRNPRRGGGVRAVPENAHDYLSGLGWNRRPQGPDSGWP